MFFINPGQSPYANKPDELTDEDLFGKAPAMPAAPAQPAVPAVSSGPQAGELSDDELFGAPAGNAPLAPPIAMTNPIPSPQTAAPASGATEAFGPHVGALIDAVIGTDPNTGLAERFGRNAGESAANTLAGGAGLTLGTMLSPEVAASREQASKAYADMPASKSLLEGATALGGQLLPQLFAVENYLFPGQRALRTGGKPVPAHTPPTAPATPLERAGEAAVGNVVTDPAVQSMNAARGEQQGYDPWEALFSTTLGATIGGGVEGARQLAGKVREAIAKLRSTPDTKVAPETITPDSVTPEEWQTALRGAGATDEQIAAMSPDFGREAAARVEDRQQTDAERAKLPPNTDMRQVAEDRQAIELGNMDPGAAATANAQRQPTPDVIPVYRSAGGDVGDRGVLAGAANSAEVRAQTRREADNAFSLAERQRQRSGSDVRDTQTAGRPEGQNQQEVMLDDGFPVEVVSRRFVPDANGHSVQVATVRRYDPRTGKAEADAVEYEVPVRQLKRANYATDPRLSQDFAARAEGPTTPEQPRMANEGVTRDPAQTYRATEPDPTVRGAEGPTSETPGRGPSPRSPRPEQPSGPGPFRERPRSEEEIIRDYEARQRAEQERAARGEQAPPNETRETDNNSSNKAKGTDTDGRYTTDDRGFVVSDKGGPIRFANQKQAAKWILNVGNKSGSDQIFEIHNHPTKGFTVRERGSTEPPKEAPKGAEANNADPVSSGAPSADQPRALPSRRTATIEIPLMHRAITDISKGDVKPNAAAVAKAYGISNSEAAQLLHDLSSRPDTPIDMAGGKYETDPQKMRWRARPIHRQETTLRQNESWARSHLGMKREDYTTQQDYLDAIEERMAIMDEANQAAYDASHGQNDTGLDGKDAAKGAGDIPFDGARADEGKVDGPNARDQGGPGDGAQGVIPGAEKSDKQAVEKRAADPLRGSKPQKAADEGLFGDGHKQGDMLDNADAIKKASDDLSDTFFSNPIADPRIWKKLASALTGAGWVKHEAEAWSNHAGEILGSIRANGGSVTTAARAMGDIVRLFAHTNDGVLRTLAARYKSDAVRDVADMFYATAGDTTRAIGKTYHAAVDEAYGKWMNRLSELLAPLEKMGHTAREAAMEQIGRLVANPRSIRAGTPVHDAAAGIAKTLKDALGYMREAGVEVGEVKNGYLPRVEDSEKILRDPEGFKRAAAKAHMADGLSANDAREAADNWFQRVLLGDIGVHSDGMDFLNIGSTNANPNFTKGRVLSKKADEIMGDFYHRNPADILPRYFLRAAQRSEWARRMGPNLEKWKTLKERMIADGAGEAIPQVVRIVQSATGNMGNITGSGRAVLSTLKTWGTFEFLSRATFSSLSEPATVGIRTGNALDSLRAYGSTVRAWVRGKKLSGDLGEVRAMGEDLGLMGTALDDVTMLQRVGGEPGGKLARRLQTTFFRHTGLTQFTEANRVAALSIGRVFLRRLAKDLDGTTFKESSTRLMQELGVPREKANAFAKFINGLDKPSAADVLSGGEMGALYQTALGRFLDQTVMKPTGAIRPRYANHPVGAMAYNLLSFIFAFQKNVLNRSGRMALDAVNPKSGLNAAERLQFAAPAAMLPMLFAIQYGLGEVRDAILTDPARKDDEPKSAWQKGLTALSRSGLTGIMDVPFNLLTSMRYQKDPATVLVGPFWGTISSGLSSAVDLTTDRNSPNTTTAERKFSRMAYDIFIKPALTAAIVGSTPSGTGLGLLAGFLGTQGASHPAAREAFVAATAGDPTPRKGSGSTRSARGGSARGGRGGARTTR